MSQSLQTIEKKISPVQEAIEHLVITGSESLVTATEYLSKANKYLDSLIEEREKVTRPLNEALKAERARFKPIETSLNEVIALLRAKMSLYQSNLIQQQQRAQEKIASKTVSGYYKTETAINKLEAMPVIDKEIATDVGLVQFREVKKFEVVDMSKLPIEYHQPDEKLIQTELKKGTELPGVRYYTEQVPVNYR